MRADEGKEHEGDLFGRLAERRIQLDERVLRVVVVVAGMIQTGLTLQQLLESGDGPLLMGMQALAGLGAVVSIGIAVAGHGGQALAFLMGTALLNVAAGQLALLSPMPTLIPRNNVRLEIVPVILLLAGALLPRLHFRVLAVGGGMAFLIHDTIVFGWLGVPLGDSVGGAVVHVVLMVLAVGAFEFTWHQQDLERESIRQHVDELGVVVSLTERMGIGELDFSLPHHNGLLGVVETLRSGLATSIVAIRRASLQVEGAAQELEATATAQSSGASEQAAAVAETRATVSAISEEVEDIDRRAEDSAVRSEAASKSVDQLSEGLEELLKHTEQIGVLLAEIASISDKSDLLALNASLEGVRAGEAGRGFALVANQMQQLADRVRDTVTRLQDLNRRVAQSSSHTREAMLGARSEWTGAAKAARDIRERVARQEQAMQQVAQSISEIAEVTHRVAAGSEQVEASAGRLVELVAVIDTTLVRFRLPLSVLDTPTLSDSGEPGGPR